MTDWRSLDRGGGSSRGPRSPGGAHAGGGYGKDLLVALVVFLFIMVWLSACDDSPHAGRVFNKQHYASYEYLIPECISYGQYGCTSWFYVVGVEPEQWKLCLRADNGDTGCREVNETTWERTQVGEWYAQPTH